MGSQNSQHHVDPLGALGLIDHRAHCSRPIEELLSAIKRHASHYCQPGKGGTLQALPERMHFRSFASKVHNAAVAPGKILLHLMEAAALTFQEKLKRAGVRGRVCMQGFLWSTS